MIRYAVELAELPDRLDPVLSLLDRLDAVLAELAELKLAEIENEEAVLLLLWLDSVLTELAVLAELSSSSCLART